MAKINKNKLDLNITLVEMKFILKGNKQIVKVYTTAIESCDFVDWLNENRVENLSRVEKEKFDNKFWVFDCLKTKQSVVIERDSIKTFTIPFFVDAGEEFDFKILEFKR